MPSFFSPSPSHGAVISSVAFTIRSFTSVSYNTFVPFWGTVLAQHGQARYPTWASTLPHLGTFAARMLPICPQYGRLRLGFLKKTEFHLSSCCFRRTKSICPSPSGEARWGLDVDMLSNNNFYIRTKTLINPRRITLSMISANHISPLSFSNPS